MNGGDILNGMQNRKFFKYDRINIEKFFNQIRSEADARDLVWRTKFDEKDFCCPRCQSEMYWQHVAKPEMRECKKCKQQVRLRAHTIMENSKIPMLVWVRSIYFVMQGKRGISALELKQNLELISYDTTWKILHKIREALRQRDAQYKLRQGYIELDGAIFGRKTTGNSVSVFVAIETKDWIDKNGSHKSKAGFAKVMVGKETQWDAQGFVTDNIEPGVNLKTDGSYAYKNLVGVNVRSEKVFKDKEILDRWLPWVHKFISNSKSWLIGTHHGIEAKYIASYLGEYTFRFNRRHDPKSLFFRALKACVTAEPKTSQALFG